MILRKTAVAVAIAGMAAAPLSVSAETTVSGIIQMQVKGTAIGNLSDNASDIGDDISDGIDDLQDQDNVDDDSDQLPDDASEDISVGAGDVRVEITSTHDLNSGLQGYGNIGFQLDDLSTEEGSVKGGQAAELAVQGPNGEEVGSIDDETTSPTVAANNIYAGIKGSFGDFRIGEGPNTSEYGQVANDIFDVSPSDLTDALHYTGIFGPVTVGLNYSFEAPLQEFGPDTNMVGLGAKFALGGFTLSGGAANYGDNVDPDADDLLRYSVGGAFGLGGVALALQYWSRENGDDLEDSTSFGGKAGYGIGDISANLTYEVLMDDPEIGGEDAEETAIRLDLGYDLGGGLEVSTRITSFANDDDDSREKTEYRLQLAKAF